MKESLKKLRIYEKDLENRIILTSIILGAILCFIAGLFNFWLGLSITSVAILLITGTVLLCCGHFTTVRQEKIETIQIASIFLSFICIPTMYFMNGGIIGSVPYYIVLFAGITSVMFKQKKKYIIVLMYLLMFALLLFLQFKIPNLVIKYSSDFERIADIAISVVITLLFNAILFNVVVRSYELEHEKCLRLNEELNEEIILRKEAEEKIKHIAHHDTLTKLPNKRYLSIEMERAIEIAKRSETMFAVLFIDFDGLKIINDSIGHFAGDQMLISASKRIHKILKKSDFVARIGGDEFIVLSEGIETIDDVKKIAFRIINVFEQPISINHQDFSISASIGIALFPLDGYYSDQLIKNADYAMYKAKENGKNQYVFHSDLNNGIVEEFEDDSQVDYLSF